MNLSKREENVSYSSATVLMRNLKYTDIKMILMTWTLVLYLATKVFFTSPDLIVKQFSLIPRAVSKQANFIGSIIKC